VLAGLCTQESTDILIVQGRKRIKPRRRRRPERVVLRSTDLDFSAEGIKLTGNVRLYQRDNGRWYVRFTLNGKRRMLSTGERDKTRALLKLGEIVREAAIKDTLGSETKLISTFAELGKEYTPYAKDNKATTTTDREKYTMRILLRTFGNKKLSEIKSLDIEQYKQIRRKEVKTSSVNRELALFRHMLNKAVDWGYLEASPARRIKPFKEPKGRIRWLNDAECERLLDACRHSKSPMLYPIVLTALTTGMRKSELQSLTWDDVDFESGIITVKQTKNNEIRHIQISKDLLPVLQELSNETPHSHYVFSKPDGTAYGNWRRSFETACRQAGIKDFRFHDLRHCFGSYLGMAGYNSYTIMALMGHKTLAMSARYTHISNDILKTAVDESGAA
jgi:integrase